MTFLCSTDKILRIIFLCIFMVGYLIMGAFVFMELENEVHNDLRSDISFRVNNFVANNDCLDCKLHQSLNRVIMLSFNVTNSNLIIYKMNIDMYTRLYNFERVVLPNLLLFRSVLFILKGRVLRTRICWPKHPALYQILVIKFWKNNHQLFSDFDSFYMHHMHAKSYDHLMSVVAVEKFIIISL